MSLETMASRLVGWLPRLPKSEAYNLINAAWSDIRNDRVWSFQLGEDGINTPNVIQQGTVTVTLGSTTVVCDATASALLSNLSFPFITQRQFRVQGYSIYSIVGFDNVTNPNAAVITLDRTYTDPSGTTLPYQVYQAYFPAPVSDFKRYIDWRDMVNGFWLDVHSTRAEVNVGDPQRLYYDFPYWVLSYQLDNRPNTSTPNFPLHELYPNPLSQISYMRWWMRTGADLIQPTDTLPYPITETMVDWRARMRGYQYMEANRDPSTPRGQSADYKFLYQAAEAQYIQETKAIGMKDRDIVDTYLSKVRRQSDSGRRLPYFSTLIGRAYSGV